MIYVTPQAKPPVISSMVHLWIMKKIVAVMDKLCSNKLHLSSIRGKLSALHHHGHDYEHDHHACLLWQELFSTVRGVKLPVSVHKCTDVSQKAPLTSSWIPAGILAYVFLFGRRMRISTLETREATGSDKGGYCHGVLLTSGNSP